VEIILTHYPNFGLPDWKLSNPVILKCDLSMQYPHQISYGCLRMKDVYEVLRQKELEVSRLKKEVEALRIAAPLVSKDLKAENENQPTSPHAVNDTPEPDHSGGQDRGKNHWP
jgi:hypothetical protein